MPSSAPFDDIRDELFAAVDAEWAEPVRLAFLKDGVADPARPALDIEAVLRTGTETAKQMDGGTNNAWKTRVAATPATLSIDRAAWPGIVMRVGDKIRATNRPGEPWFEVLHVDDRSHRRLILTLGEA